MGRKKSRQTAGEPGQSRRHTSPDSPEASGLEVNGWAILAHPLFLDAMEKLTAAVGAERAKDQHGPPSANAKLLAHLLDLAFNKILADPGSPAYRHGGTLAGDRRHWFRARTGGGRYRLFYRFHSTAKLIVYAWVNDEHSLRTYGGKTDAYAVFAGMLDGGNPPDHWDDLVKASSGQKVVRRLRDLGNAAVQE